MPLILPGNVASATASTGYDVANSCRFNDGDSAYMHKTPGSGGDTEKFTVSFWVKRSALGTNQNIFHAYPGSGERSQILFKSDDTLMVELEAANTNQLVTTRVFRDVSAWYHIVVVYDSDNGTSGNRVIVYVNGTRETSFGTETYPSSGAASGINTTTQHEISSYDGSGYYFDGYMAEVCFVDGSALAPTSFGEFDEDSPTIWKPIDVSGLTFGTNGFYLDFEDSANLGNDANGGTDLTETNLDATDSATDSPTNNFCTGNPLVPDAQTFSEGNTKFTNSSGHNWRVALSTIAPSAGKWYCEVKITENGGGSQIGVADMNNLPDNLATDIGSANWSWSYKSSDGNARHDGGSASWGNTFTTDDVMGIAMDLDNYKLYFAKNGTWQDSGDPTSGATGTGSAFDLDAGGAYAFGFTSNDTGTDPVLDINYGNPAFSISSGNADANGYGNFEYAVPSGYYALCTKNLGAYGG